MSELWKPPADLARRARPVCHDVIIVPDFLDASLAQRFYGGLCAEPIDWQQEELRMFGRTHKAPRLTAWAADEGVSYSYSGVAHRGWGIGGTLAELRERIEAALCTAFNFVLVNRYRDGADGMGWHADDEPELGDFPVIASLSLGATRRFRLRARRSIDAVNVDLRHGSLLIMHGASQQLWRHCVPKTKRVVAERINLTFRHVKSV